MLDSNGYTKEQSSHLQSPKLGANFVSPLQKAASHDAKSSIHSWLQQCYEVMVSCTSPDVSLPLPIDGGSDAGLFCVVGIQVDQLRVVYHDGTKSSAYRHSLKPGDIILSLNEYDISGYTRRDAVELCDLLTRVARSDSGTQRPRLRIRLCPPEALATGNTMLSSFLAAAFSLNSPEYALQEKIRENVYQRVVPCTTRLPRADEIDGVHYRFMSVPQFVALEASGQLLESGMYKGNHYGTPRPEPDATALDSLLFNHLTTSISSSIQLTDESCPIPPPLPPLASLTNMLSTAQPMLPSESPASNLPVQHPQPPRPPVRHSSISTQSTTTKDKTPVTVPPDRLNGFHEPQRSLTSSHNEVQADSPGSIDLGPLSYRWDSKSDESKSYFLDCDIVDSRPWESSNLCFTDPTTVTTSVAFATQTSPDPMSYPSAFWTTNTDISRSLPYGWEVIRDPKYGTFYIDHIHERTQYEPPTEEDFTKASAVQTKLSHGNVDITNTRDTPSNALASTAVDLSTTTCSEPRSSSLFDRSLQDRISPTTFTTDPNGLRGPLVTTTVFKSPRGFGFTIVGGADCAGFLQTSPDPMSYPSAFWTTNTDISRSLPYGWEVIRDPKYGTFYIDHIHERTQYEPPTEEDFTKASAVQTKLSHGNVDITNTRDTPSNALASTAVDLSTTTCSEPRSSSLFDRSLQDRISPTTFTTDPNGLRGPLVTTTVFKSPRGFGFTIVGGADCAGFLQVKHIVPGGPASTTKLAVGDLLVKVNSTNVLGCTHAELVSLLQSIPVGSPVQLTISQAYCLRSDLPESSVHSLSSTMDDPNASTPGLSVGVDGGTSDVSSGPDHPPVSTNTPRQSSLFSGSSSTTSTSTSVLSPRLQHESNPVSSLESIQMTTAPAHVRPRFAQRPEFLKVTIVKQPNGFGFTLADHPQGQHVKAILDPIRCGRLQVGDVVVEINDQRVKEVPHSEVVQILKQCHVGQEARLLIQRGGLYTSPFSLFALERRPANQSPTDDKALPIANAQIDFKTSAISQSSQEMDYNDFKSVSTTSYKPSSDLPNSNHTRTLSGGIVEFCPTSPAPVHFRSRTPEPHRTAVDQVTAHSTFGHSPLSVTIPAMDRRRRMQPSDDSVLDFCKLTPVPGSPNPSVQYGSLLRPGRMPPLPQAVPRLSDGQSLRQPNACANRASFLMLPGEFLVHLQRQSTGFGFNVVGGAEESSQVVIGSLVPGGAAQMSGVVRSGDRLVSINGLRVVGAKHKKVVQLLEQAAHSVGQVTLGLQRQPEVPVTGGQRNTVPLTLRDAVEVVVPRSQRGDGFGFFITNRHPSGLANGDSDPRSSNKSYIEGEFIAQLVPGSKAERLGLLSVGDQILAVNKVPITGLHHEQVVRLIRESGNHIILTIIPSQASLWVSRPPLTSTSDSVSVEFPVILSRDSRGFGFSIRGGQEFNQMPLVVLRIAEGGAAQMDGQLKVGDELIEINGHSTVGMSHYQAIKIIQAGGNTMRLAVRRHKRIGKPGGDQVGAMMPAQRHANSMRVKLDRPQPGFGKTTTVTDQTQRNHHNALRPYSSTKLASCAFTVNRSPLLHQSDHMNWVPHSQKKRPQTFE
ncbi:hypothetical protein AHF37_00026 [Paragonimus kellicotti]|nr:hypothetical protein AHF37_00026 [Paragonimus kellicotti]